MFQLNVKRVQSLGSVDVGVVRFEVEVSVMKITANGVQELFSYTTTVESEYDMDDVLRLAYEDLIRDFKAFLELAEYQCERYRS